MKTLPWKPLRGFRNPGVPKLDNLRRAHAAGLRVPATVWVRASDAAAAGALPPEIARGPFILRSGSPTEDTRETSNAGQLLSVVVHEPGQYARALAKVVAALPKDADGAPLGAVFAQPLVQAAEAGVAFFDGFHYERTIAAGGNDRLTAGLARGEVTRGHLTRGDAWSAWLARVYAVFGRGARGGTEAIDIEFARDRAGYVLLQVRPALFPVARNETLSLANHKEILGDPPSPWIASVLGAAGREVLSFFAEVDPAVAAWGDAYAVEVGERAWMNFSFFYRLMDHWGLPRAFVTEGVGGEGGPPEDGRVIPGRFLRHTPTLVRLQWTCVRTVRDIPRALAELDARIDGAASLPELFDANVASMTLAIRTNFAINSVLSGVTRVRRALGVRGAARVVTREMMERYGALATLPAEAREAGLDAWLAEFGHRGPLESDPSRPRFREMREVLLRDLAASAGAAGGSVRAGAETAAGWRIARPFYWMDERREWFRDELMRRWQRLRARLLDEGHRLYAAGALDAPEDVFLLRGAELAPGTDLRAAALAARARMERARRMDLPPTASRERIEQACADVERAEAAAAGRRVFPGIALVPARVEGRAVKADDLASLLMESADGSGRLGPDAILVVPALEPSWAVVFPRVLGVVAEIGGELSHASILLREAGRPAVVNCAGIFREVRTGDRLRLDGPRALVEIIRD
ncbi:PEP-utilizing enzyme [Longimicrobium sp.]|uniref:PEP-utilizing enzyme n=1 Tax=Longimicrobium sp. TaxID=2029185 RepID=UPI002E2F3ECB|nr:PEP-utilizing enzyme [Longimicrobium sp.]HEX6037677.1 PEP-utilizing enzyme [Longimicrobium sp.]